MSNYSEGISWQFLVEIELNQIFNEFMTKFIECRRKKSNELTTRLWLCVLHFSLFSQYTTQTRKKKNHKSTKFEIKINQSKKHLSQFNWRRKIFWMEHKNHWIRFNAKNSTRGPKFFLSVKEITDSNVTYKLRFLFMLAVRCAKQNKI